LPNLATPNAVEFQDAKLMLGKVENVARANWRDVTKALSVKRLIDSAKLVGVMNWTILLNLTEMLRCFETEVVISFEQATHAVCGSC
jgi:hypothetical protein